MIDYFFLHIPHRFVSQLHFILYRLEVQNEVAEVFQDLSYMDTLPFIMTFMCDLSFKR